MKRRHTLKWMLHGFCVLSLSPQMICNRNESFERESTEPSILSMPQIDVMNILADLIIPKCEIAPAPSEIGIAMAVDQILFHFYNANNQDQVKMGLDNVNKLCYQLYNKYLPQSTAGEQFEVWKYLANDGAQSQNPQDHLFFIIRQLVIQGYFQSRYINEHVLRYDPIPGSYQACLSIDDNVLNWSL